MQGHVRARVWHKAQEACQKKREFLSSPASRLISLSTAQRRLFQKNTSTCSGLTRAFHTLISWVSSSSFSFSSSSSYKSTPLRKTPLICDTAISLSPSLLFKQRMISRRTWVYLCLCVYAYVFLTHSPIHSLKPSFLRCEKRKGHSLKQKNEKGNWGNKSKYKINRTRRLNTQSNQPH